MPRPHLIVALALAALVAGPVSPAAENHVKGATPIHISQGQTINLADYLVPGKTTVFDFFSEYCGPCMRIAPELEKLHARRADIALVKVDINRPGHQGIDWQSPVARQYDLHSIPHFKIFGPDGKLKAEGDEAYEMVMNWLR